MVESPVIAENAVSLIKGSRHKNASKKNTINITLTGVIVVELTLYKNFEQGRAPSLAMANPILDVTVKLLKPAKNILMIKSDVIASAPLTLFFPSTD
jgi:hypothetical protein